MTLHRLYASALLAAGFLATTPALAQSTPPSFGTGFTYQGRLVNQGIPINGNVDLGFTLWNAPGHGNPPTGGQVIGGMAITNVPVTDGLFTVVLNADGQFGPNAFSGGDRWLQIAVNQQILAPRQQISAAPFAQRALAADNAGHAELADVATEARSVDGITGYSLHGAEDGVADAVYVDPQGNVGIGTTTPSAHLHNTGDYYGRGSFSLFSVVGDGNDGPALIRARDHSNTSSLGMAFTTQFFGYELLAMTINSEGDVLIGDTSAYDPHGANAKLDVRGNGIDPALRVDTGLGGFSVEPYDPAPSTTAIDNPLGGFAFTSYIGIYRDPHTELDVHGELRVSGNSRLGSYDALPYSNVTLQVDENDNDWAISVHGDADIDGTAWADAFLLDSDARYKKNIATFQGGLDAVTRLRGVRYDLDRERWPDRNFSDRPQIGFIAQEVETVLPELVSYNPDGYRAVDYARVSAILVEAIHEISAREAESCAELAKVQAENAALTARLDALEARLGAIEGEKQHAVAR